MREILFRGKRIDNGEWVEGWLYKRIVHLDNCHQNVVVDAIEVYDGKNLLTIAYYTIDPATVGQYIGLTDKNGKKIFEGDIVRLHGEDLPGWYRENPITAVEYNDCGFEPLCEYDGYCEGFVRPTDCEIIGNIHDNPELVKGGET